MFPQRVQQCAAKRIQKLIVGAFIIQIALAQLLHQRIQRPHCLLQWNIQAVTTGQHIVHLREKRYRVPLFAAMHYLLGAADQIIGGAFNRCCCE